ncbi:branched-chain amino acid transport system permease protein [Azospirillum agricola]|uniref:branched-chain amino acid ABC transporter permease n=1 Tax=Azospirillum agricola TaxID=1720247 RepID=UPI001AE6198D|nr:branched-chain amino acid ABC transporter permease [Azospirillum agricola]MBP2230014.1 branched-chain amino acid transport system permease protein [Azospirillum agricola]
MAEWLDDFLFTYENLIHALGIHGLLALSMYCVMALGQLSLGQAAFMGLGAYTGALLTLKLGLPFWLVLPISALVPALVALVIGGPTLRLNGVYLAISTIALGEVLRVLYINAESLTGGALGLSGIPQKASLWLVYGLLAVCIAGFWAIGRSRIGRAMEAMREDEMAAGVMGVNLPLYKLGALIASAMLAGLAGSLAAHSNSFIGPNEYGFEAAVTILSFALLGGIGTPIAPVIGAFVLTALPELLRPLADFRLVFNGLIIVLAVLFLPRGIVPFRLRRAP